MEPDLHRVAAAEVVASVVASGFVTALDATKSFERIRKVESGKCPAVAHHVGLRRVAVALVVVNVAAWHARWIVAEPSAVGLFAMHVAVHFAVAVLALLELEMMKTEAPVIAAAV